MNVPLATFLRARVARLAPCCVASTVMMHYTVELPGGKWLRAGVRYAVEVPGRRWLHMVQMPR